MGLILEARGPFFFHTACLLGLLDSSDSVHGKLEFQTVGVAWSNKPGCKARLHDDIPV